MDSWIMRAAYTSQTATISKLLREGFEPFWGYRCTHNNKVDVRMYFRKPPEVVSTLLPKPEKVEPISIEPIVAALNELKNTILETYKPVTEQNIDVSIDAEKFVEHLKPFMNSVSSNNPLAPIAKEKNEEPESEIEAEGIPRGESFKVVDDVPHIPSSRTEQQEAEISELRRIHNGENLTIIPPDQEGVVRVYVADLIYVISPGGGIVATKNKAGRTSL